MTWAPHTQSAAARGYDGTHRKIRAALIPYAVGQPCPICGETMLATEVLSLDHITPRCEGGRTEPGNCRIVHELCNRRRGAATGSARRWAKPRRLSRSSRVW